MDLPGAVWQKKWCVRRVVEQVERVKINELIGMNPRSPEYWSRYTNTVTGLIEKFDSETRRQYEILAEKWNKTGPPPEVQRRHFHNILPSVCLLKFTFAGKPKTTCTIQPWPL